MTGLRERNKARRRDAILDATLDHLRSQPFEDVTVEHIAASAEVSPHTVYNLVGTRDEIIQALIGRVVRQMIETSPTFDARLAEPEQPLRAVYDHALDALFADPVAYRRVVRLGVAQPDWPAAAKTAPAHLVEAADLLRTHGVLAQGITPAMVAQHSYHGFGGWLMAWAVGYLSGERLRSEVHRNVSIVLAATTIGAVRSRAAANLSEEHP